MKTQMSAITHPLHFIEAIAFLWVSSWKDDACAKGDKDTACEPLLDLREARA
jgi:hypothetical protein